MQPIFEMLFSGFDCSDMIVNDVDAFFCPVADNVEVAYLKTLTKENIMHFYRVSSTNLQWYAKVWVTISAEDELISKK